MDEDALDDSSPSLPSLDIALDLARDRTTAQLGAIDALDAKANFVLTSASVVVATSLAVGGNAALFASSAALARVVRVVLLFFVILIYLGIVACVFKAYKARDYKQAPVPRKLHEKYIHRPASQTKEYMLMALSDVYDANAVAIKNKALWTNRALKALVVESAVLGVGILIQAAI